MIAWSKDGLVGQFGVPTASPFLSSMWKFIDLVGATLKASKREPFSIIWILGPVGFGDSPWLKNHRPVFSKGSCSWETPVLPFPHGNPGLPKTRKATVNLPTIGLVYLSERLREDREILSYSYLINSSYSSPKSAIIQPKYMSCETGDVLHPTFRLVFRAFAVKDPHSFFSQLKVSCPKCMSIWRYNFSGYSHIFTHMGGKPARLQRVLFILNITIPRVLQTSTLEPWWINDHNYDHSHP